MLQHTLRHFIATLDLECDFPSDDAARASDSLWPASSSVLDLSSQVITNIAFARAQLEAGRLQFQDFLTDVGALIRKLQAVYAVKEKALELRRLRQV